MSSTGRADSLAIQSLAVSMLGALHGLVFAVPEGLATPAWMIQLLLMTALCWLILPGSRNGRISVRRSAWLTWLFGLAQFTVGLYWLYISMHHFGGMPAPIAAAAVVVLSAYVALFGAAAVAITVWLVTRHLNDSAASARPSRLARPLTTALTLGACWGLAEMARGWLFTGFPWLSIGYAHVDSPLIGLAPFAGVYAIGMVATGLAALLAGALRERSAWALGLACLTLLATIPLAGIAWGQAVGTAPMTVRLMQGNVPQSLKFDRAVSEQVIADYTAIIANSPATLTISPETAFTRPLEALPPQAKQALLAALASSGTTAALGMPMRVTDDQASARPRAQITNSMITLNADGQRINRYDKQHLVPFGEFIPLGFSWFVDLMNIPLGEFGRGVINQPLLSIGDHRVAFNICYEDLFGEELAMQVRDGATMLVNTSNLAWFGDTIALPQHLNISRLRSRELARPMLRATNTGVTAHIDPMSRVIAQLPNNHHGVLDTSVLPMQGLTPFARAGSFAPLILALIMLGLAALTGRPRRLSGHVPARTGRPDADR